MAVVTQSDRNESSEASSSPLYHITDGISSMSILGMGEGDCEGVLLSQPDAAWLRTQIFAMT